MYAWYSNKSLLVLYVIVHDYLYINKFMTCIKNAYKLMGKATIKDQVFKMKYLKTY